MTPRAFYDSYIEAARRNEAENGVPALFTLAQSALETGWAKNAPGNMMFGIKAGPGWGGKRQLCTTREFFKDRLQGSRFPQVISITPRMDKTGRCLGYDYVVKDWFRAYDDPFESFADHAAMLRANARYARAFETTDPREFARRIAAAGYATAPNYAASLIPLIDVLEKIDAEAAADNPAPPAPGAIPEGYVMTTDGNVVSEPGRKSTIEDHAEKGQAIAAATAATGVAGGAATLFKAVPPWASGIALCLLAVAAVSLVVYFVFIKKRRQAMTAAGVV